MIVIAWIVLGVLSGFIWLKMVSQPTRGVSLALGAAGAVVGGVLFTAVRWRGGVETGSLATLVSLIGSVLGAIAVLATCYRLWPALAHTRRG